MDFLVDDDYATNKTITVKPYQINYIQLNSKIISKDNVLFAILLRLRFKGYDIKLTNIFGENMDGMTQAYLYFAKLFKTLKTNNFLMLNNEYLINLANIERVQLKKINKRKFWDIDFKDYYGLKCEYNKENANLLQKLQEIKNEEKTF